MWLSAPRSNTVAVGVDVAGQRLGEVGQALVDPVHLVRVGVVLQQVLVLVGERALVEDGRAGRLVHRSSVGSSGGFAPVRCGQSNASIVITLRSSSSLNCEEKKPGDVGRRGREVVEVVVPDVVDQRDDLVAVAGVVAAVPMASGPRALEPSRSGGVLKAADSFGNMLLSNWSTRSATCASVTSVVSGDCVRQSPGREAVSLATQTSILSPTPRSV